MNRQLLIGLFMFGTAAQADVVMVSPYEFFFQEVADAETACRQRLDEKFAEVDGLSQIGVQSPFIWMSDTITGVQFVLYSDVQFTSEHGNATGSVLCSTNPETRTLLELAIAFNGRGLAGFRPMLPDQTPADAFRTATAFGTTSQY